ncbi:hypothetical protein Taro_002874 [Colocasia esculenta]|uniref:Uncharacterized protein n=1 Tax=Colocasia esculenta TaxID=4460 RepID=A0A843TDZ2_COLES|nr:hypothetical protein [Colocasia esculenta]
MPQALDAAGGSFDAGGGGGGGSHFSFAAPVTGRKGHGPDGEGGEEEYGTWIQKVRGSYGYLSRLNDLKQGAWRKVGAGNRRDVSVEGREPKGVARPEAERLGEKARPLRLVPVYPSSQSQAMARYRQEMMELVRGVPESAYELSLRDLVEVPRLQEAPRDQEEAAGKERGGGPEVAVTGREKEEEKEKKVKRGKKLILRSASMDSGVFLLRMFFPTSLGRWRRKSSSSGIGAKVSPKPVMAAEGEKRRPEKEVDAEWLVGSGEISTRDEIKNSGQRRSDAA